MSVPYQITVGLRFRPSDAPVLRELARRDWTHDEDQRSAFDEAADAAENGTLLVVQTMTRASLDEIVALFSRAGIHSTVEDLRLESVLRRGLKLRV